MEMEPVAHDEDDEEGNPDGDYKAMWVIWLLKTFYVYLMIIIQKSKPLSDFFTFCGSIV
jgi:hypothetical protein